MNPRFLAASAVALASLTLSSAHAAIVTEVVYTGPTVLQLNVDADVSAYIQNADGGRIGGPAGSEPSLRFVLGAINKLVKAPANQSLIKTTIKPSVLGEGQ